jgi:23S rRNA pseudouridine1911/1915/1917 synthase
VQKALASLERQALHAERIAIPHPRTGEAMMFVSPLPEDLREVLTLLGS